MAATLFVSATATGLTEMASVVRDAAQRYARAPRGPYSHAPLPAYRGKKPGKSKTRGGLWNNRALEVAEIGDGNLFAWIFQGPPPTSGDGW